MRIVKSSILVAVATFLMPVFAHGDSLDDVQFWKTQAGLISEDVKQTNIACGTSITLDFVNKPDFRTKATNNKDANGNDNHASPYGTCAPITKELTMSCSDPDAKARIQKKVTKIACGWGQPRTAALSGGTASVMLNVNEPDTGKWMHEQFGKLL